MLLFAAVGFLLILSSQAQMQDQCLCSEFNPCADSAADAVQSCAEKCQSHVTALGASFPAARQCIISHMDRIHQAVSCSRASLGNVCASSSGQMVPRRYPETFQLAAFREINSILTKSGLLSQATTLLQAGRKGLGCMMKCGQQNSCVKRLGCGLALPPDNTIITSVKGCIIQSGFTTPIVREICNCLLNSGISQLAPMCGKIIIS